MIENQAARWQKTDGAVTAVTLLVTRRRVTDNTPPRQHTGGTCHVSPDAHVTDKTLSNSGLYGLTLEPTPFSDSRILVWIFSFMGFMWNISISDLSSMVLI